MLLLVVGFHSTAWARDPIMYGPLGKLKRIRTEAVRPADEIVIYSQTISDAPGMGEWRSYNQDFGWTHTFDVAYSYVQWSDLNITALDVDYDEGQRDLIYADGQYLGPLQGGDSGWWPTSFAVPISTLLPDGKLAIWVDVDSTHDYEKWMVTIGSSTLRVAYVLKPDREEAFRRLDDKWNTLSQREKASKVRNQAVFNGLTARYATMTARQVESAIEKVKASNPAYAKIETRLVKALIYVESANNFLALSDQGALGLGQKLTGAVNAKKAFANLQRTLDLAAYKYGSLALDSRTLPEQSIDLALAYLNWLANLPIVSNDIDRMLAAYNCGPGCLRRLLQSEGSGWMRKLPDETKDYIPKIKEKAGTK